MVVLIEISKVCILLAACGCAMVFVGECFRLHFANVPLFSPALVGLYLCGALSVIFIWIDFRRDMSEIREFV